MKAANAAIRKGKTPEAKLANLMALGVSEGTARDFLKPDCFGFVGFAPYSLQNSNANIRRVEQRIRELERAAAAESRGGRAGIYLPGGHGGKPDNVPFSGQTR